MGEKNRRKFLGLTYVLARRKVVYIHRGSFYNVLSSEFILPPPWIFGLHCLEKVLTRRFSGWEDFSDGERRGAAVVRKWTTESINI